MKQLNRKNDKIFVRTDATVSFLGSFDRLYRFPKSFLYKLGSLFYSLPPFIMTSTSTIPQQTYIALYQGKHAGAFIQTGAGFEVLHKCIVIGYCKGVNPSKAWKDLEKYLSNFLFRKKLIPDVLEDIMLYRLDTPEIYYSKDEI